MPRPRVFLSSTYYDLRHLRSSLEDFIGGVGFEPVLSEKGSVSYDPSIPLDQSCYHEVEEANIFVLLIGGRYGSPSSVETGKLTGEFYERYNSVTKEEFKTAIAKDIPVYVLIESKVDSEYRTFTNNRGRSDIKYAHVDSVNVFHLIDDILALQKNNAVHKFDCFSDIKGWLLRQWAGLFLDLLQEHNEPKHPKLEKQFRKMVQRESESNEVSFLSAQVEELSDIVLTLAKDVASMNKRLPPTEAADSSIDCYASMEDQVQLSRLRRNVFVSDLIRAYDVKLIDLAHILIEAKSYEELAGRLEVLTKRGGYADMFLETLRAFRDMRSYIESARRTMGLGVLEWESVKET